MSSRRRAAGNALLGAGALGLGVALAVFGVERRARHKGIREQQAAMRDRPQAPGSTRLSVVVPAYMEAERIGSTIAQLRLALDAKLGDGEVEIVIVDDGSPDNTAEVARRAGADIVIEFESNRGKGAAVREGVMAATGRTITFIDADLSYPPEQLLHLMERVESGYDMVVGSRRHVETKTLVKARRLRELSGRVFNLLTEAVLLGQYRDTQCGLKAWRSDVARDVFSRARIDRFAFDVETFFLAEHLELSLAEIPVTLSNSTTSTVSVGSDALQMMGDLWRIRRMARAGVYDVAR